MLEEHLELRIAHLETPSSMQIRISSWVTKLSMLIFLDRNFGNIEEHCDTSRPISSEWEGKGLKISKKRDYIKARANLFNFSRHEGRHNDLKLIQVVITFRDNFAMGRNFFAINFLFQYTRMNFTIVS